MSKDPESSSVASAKKEFETAFCETLPLPWDNRGFE